MPVIEIDLHKPRSGYYRVLTIRAKPHLASPQDLAAYPSIARRQT
jgi:hypothetical protein